MPYRTWKFQRTYVTLVSAITFFKARKYAAVKGLLPHPFTPPHPFLYLPTGYSYSLVEAIWHSVVSQFCRKECFPF
jgi:hypothetical protein